jgi:hypothetical protein
VAQRGVLREMKRVSFMLKSGAHYPDFIYVDESAPPPLVKSLVLDASALVPPARTQSKGDCLSLLSSTVNTNMDNLEIGELDP